jgi:hypothetical protein
MAELIERILSSQSGNSADTNLGETIDTERLALIIESYQQQTEELRNIFTDGCRKINNQENNQDFKIPEKLIRRFQDTTAYLKLPGSNGADIKIEFLDSASIVLAFDDLHQGADSLWRNELKDHDERREAFKQSVKLLEELAGEIIKIEYKYRHIRGEHVPSDDEC